MQEILGSFEETTPGTLTIPHSSGKDIEVINTQKRGKASRKDTVATVENKFPRYQAFMVEYGILKRKKCNEKSGMAVSIFTTHRIICWWKEKGTVEWEKSVLTKFVFYRENERNSTILKARKIYKSISYRHKALLRFKFCCPKSNVPMSVTF